MIVAASDKYNMAPPQGLLPLTLFLVLLGIGVALGMQTCKYCVYQRLPLRHKISETINFLQRMLSIPAVISVHASSCLLRGTEKKYLPTESNCVISVYFYSPRRADGTLFFSVNIGFGVRSLRLSLVRRLEWVSMIYSSRKGTQKILPRHCEYRR
jgi:hypothetical protein